MASLIAARHVPPPAHLPPQQQLTAPTRTTSDAGVAAAAAVAARTSQAAQRPQAAHSTPSQPHPTSASSQASAPGARLLAGLHQQPPLPPPIQSHYIQLDMIRLDSGPESAVNNAWTLFSTSNPSSPGRAASAATPSTRYNDPSASAAVTSYPGTMLRMTTMPMSISPPSHAGVGPDKPTSSPQLELGLLLEPRLAATQVRRHTDPSDTRVGDSQTSASASTSGQTAAASAVGRPLSPHQVGTDGIYSPRAGAQHPMQPSRSSPPLQSDTSLIPSCLSFSPAYLAQETSTYLLPARTSPTTNHTNNNFPYSTTANTFANPNSSTAVSNTNNGSSHNHNTNPPPHSLSPVGALLLQAYHSNSSCSSTAQDTVSRHESDAANAAFMFLSAPAAKPAVIVPMRPTSGNGSQQIAGAPHLLPPAARGITQFTTSQLPGVQASNNSFTGAMPHPAATLAAAVMMQQTGYRPSSPVPGNAMQHTMQVPMHGALQGGMQAQGPVSMQGAMYGVMLPVHGGGLGYHSGSNSWLNSGLAQGHSASSPMTSQTNSAASLCSSSGPSNVYNASTPALSHSQTMSHGGSNSSGHYRVQSTGLPASCESSSTALFADLSPLTRIPATAGLPLNRTSPARSEGIQIRPRLLSNLHDPPAPQPQHARSPFSNHALDTALASHKINTGQGSPVLNRNASLKQHDLRPTTSSAHHPTTTASVPAPSIQATRAQYVSPFSSAVANSTPFSSTPNPIVSPFFRPEASWDIGSQTLPSTISPSDSQPANPFEPTGRQSYAAGITSSHADQVSNNTANLRPGPRPHARSENGGISGGSAVPWTGMPQGHVYTMFNHTYFDPAEYEQWVAWQKEQRRLQLQEQVRAAGDSSASSGNGESSPLVQSPRHSAASGGGGAVGSRLGSNLQPLPLGTAVESGLAVPRRVSFEAGNGSSGSGGCSTCKSPPPFMRMSFAPSNWEINASELTLNNRIGMGSYGEYEMCGGSLFTGKSRLDIQKGAVCEQEFMWIEV